jgi:signal transduction histidine kinase
VRALRLAAVQYENMARYDEAIASARAALALLDIRFATEEAGKAAALGEELQRIERLRAGRAIAALAELPPMNDAGTRMAMSLLVTLWSPAYITGDTTLARLLSATLVRLSLEHGNVGESAYGYVTHAITVGALQADYRAADEYGRLALAVNQRLDDLRLRAKVYQQFHAHVNFWCHPIPSCVPYAREAIAAGLDSGDFVYAGYAAGTELWAAIAAMQDLGAFEREYAPRVALLERLKNPGFADMARLILAWARALQGPPPAAGLPPALGPGFDEAQWLERYGHVRFFACIHAVARLQLALLLGDAQQALSCARRSQGLADAAPGTLWPLMHELWHALALARAAAPDSGVVWADDAARDEALQAIGRAQAAFAAREQHSAVNFRPPALLLEGELARLQGRAGDALLAHAGAAQFAADAGLRLMQALAHEGLARTHAAIGQTAVAALHQQRAAECYRTGGLHGKVAALLAAAARADPPAPTPIASAAAAQGGPTGSAHELDLASVLKAADAIAAEQETDALLARLLHIAIENAGAERGALVLESTEGPVLHSYEAGGSAPLVQALELSQRVPHSIVNYVRHTGETVVRARVAEASHARDEYLHTHAPRSLACLPVRALARTIGVLYLEHRHAEEVFTATRLATLQAIAMLAAIALENTRLVGGLRGEVEERREAQERLYEALTQVQRLKDDLELENSYLRRDLIANVSHDLRTPLVSLRGYVELVAAKGEALPAAEREQYLAIALKQSERLAGLIDELFDLAKLDFKGIRLNRERFAFGELAADVAQKFALAAKSRGVQISVQVGEPLPFVDADLGLVERVLDNLIGNALKHTPEGGRVAVRARPAGSHGLAEVQDSGEGIAAADLPHVFDRFYRGSGGAAAASNGAGLGLAIARRIVELHDGEIGAASAPGGGARLWFTLPVTSAPGAGAAPPG